jgi:hypothetical protein
MILAEWIENFRDPDKQPQYVELEESYDRMDKTGETMIVRAYTKVGDKAWDWESIDLSLRSS